METTCLNCRQRFKSNPRVKNQDYCSRKVCQRARRARWYREKLAKDPAYRDNQKRCRQEGRQSNPDYYRNYRSRHPEYVNRNRAVQIKRNLIRRKDKIGRLIANIDALNKRSHPRKPQFFRIVPENGKMIANIDSLIVKLIPYNVLEKHG